MVGSPRRAGLGLLLPGQGGRMALSRGSLEAGLQSLGLSFLSLSPRPRPARHMSGHPVAYGIPGSGIRSEPQS